MKLWVGRTSGVTSRLADDFNTSLPFDCRMYRQDIEGSRAHAAMLGAQGILTEAESQALTDGLGQVLVDIESGILPFDDSCEDIHMFVEQVLTERLGDVGKKLHTARSRNDQVALDLRLYLREQLDSTVGLVKALIATVTDKAELYADTIMPGYTHMQRAQPITFGHHLMAYAMMLLRDLGRLSDCRKRMNVSPIGSCALAGTTYHTDRVLEAKLLGFDDVAYNSMDAVSDRDFCIEYLNCLATVMLHLSRFSEEIILWCSWEFQFVELSDEYTTGSSIMPQKKNPDMAELVRGKTGRVYGDLMSLYTTMKGLPLAYNKDMQEDKEAVFDACDTVTMCLKVFDEMLKGLKARPDRMLQAARRGFLNATDLADYLVGKGLPFRTAYKISGQAVADCIQKNLTLEDYSLEEYQALSGLIQADVYEALDLRRCVEKRVSLGGTAPESVKQQIRYVRERYLL